MLYTYTDCCGATYFQSVPFSKEQIEQIDKEAKVILDACVDDISKEINKMILKRIIEEKAI